MLLALEIAISLRLLGYLQRYTHSLHFFRKYSLLLTVWLDFTLTLATAIYFYYKSLGHNNTVLDVY